MLTVTKEVTWDMAHRLDNHPGLCKNLHGHTYKLQATFAGKKVVNGMVADFGNLSKMLKRIAEQLDHICLLNSSSERDNRIGGLLSTEGCKVLFLSVPPTAENMLDYISTLIKVYMSVYTKEYAGIKLARLRLYETPTSFAEVEYDLSGD